MVPVIEALAPFATVVVVCMMSMFHREISAVIRKVGGQSPKTRKKAK